MSESLASIEVLSSVEEFQHVLESSYTTPVLLFKHSATCPVSARACKALTAFVEENHVPLVVKMVVVQEARFVAEVIEAETGIEHESPQAIVLAGGKAVWDESHFRITAQRLHEAVQNAAKSMITMTRAAHQSFHQQ
jgi:bacillithiol system protein YtxJ